MQEELEFWVTQSSAQREMGIKKHAHTHGRATEKL